MSIRIETSVWAARWVAKNFKFVFSLNFYISFLKFVKINLRVGLVFYTWIHNLRACEIEIERKQIVNTIIR